MKTNRFRIAEQRDKIVQYSSAVRRNSASQTMSAIYSDPGPSTSTNIPPIVRIAWATTEEEPVEQQQQVDQLDEEESRGQPKKDPLVEAWLEFQERVSVAGWQEVFGRERIHWIRRMYQIVLTIFSIVCVYYIYKVVRDHMTRGFVDEINDFPSEDSMPMSNVSICAQIYFNETFVRHNLTIPDRVWEKMNERGIDEDEFYRQLTLYLTVILRPHPIDPFLQALFRMVILNNPQIIDYRAFTDDAWLPCESMLRRCWFDGIEFDCCRKAIMSYDEDGVCYVLMLNIDSNNAQPSDATFRQRTPGPSGGLTVEASVDLEDFPWLEDDAQNGFRVLVAHTPYSGMLSPLGAPHNSEIFVKVIAERHHLSSNCSNSGELRGPTSKDLYYDPEGGSCLVQNLVDNIRKFVSCDLTAYLHRPNRSITCSPTAMYLVTSILTENGYAEKLASQLKGLASSFNANFSTLMESATNATKSGLSDKARCPYHCQYWTYSSSASFVYLENRDPIEEKRKRIYGKIHVYYGSLGYRQHTEVKASTVYLAFCDFGNVVGLYWGMSVISFFHVLYYVPKYLYVRNKLAHKVGAKRLSVS